MTINDYSKKFGWESEVELNKPHRFMSVVVCFESEPGREDATEFDIKSFNKKELTELFSDFCKENNIKSNLVCGIYITKAAATMEELING